MSFQTIIEEYIAAVQDVQAIRYFSLAASVILIYDLLITLDMEITHIWTAPWSAGKCLFLLNRYYTLSAAIFNNYIIFSPNLTDKLCLHWFRWQGATGILTVAITELILQLRLYALYSMNRGVVVVMSTIFFATLVTSTTLVFDGVFNISATSNEIPGLPFCTRGTAPIGFYHFWIPVLVSESVLCGLAVFRGVQRYLHRSPEDRTRQPLLEILIRDSILYFLMVFATYLANTIIFLIGTDTQMECVISYAVVISSVMCNRLCLNVRDMVKPYEISSLRMSKLSLPIFMQTITLPGTSPLDSTTPADETMSTEPETDIDVMVGV